VQNATVFAESRSAFECSEVDVASVRVSEVVAPVKETRRAAPMLTQRVPSPNAVKPAAAWSRAMVGRLAGWLVTSWCATRSSSRSPHWVAVAYISALPSQNPVASAACEMCLTLQRRDDEATHHVVVSWGLLL
jgi:hypothetical protein